MIWLVKYYIARVKVVVHILKDTRQVVKYVSIVYHIILICQVNCIYYVVFIWLSVSQSLY